MTNNRTDHVYTLFIDYLFCGKMTVEDCISIMEGFTFEFDYEGSLGVYNALVDYVCYYSLADFNII